MRAITSATLRVAARPGSPGLAITSATLRVAARPGSPGLAIATLFVGVLAGCPTSGNGECSLDSDCGNNVCARDGECLPASDVYPVKVTWTIHGMAASATTCAPAPDFYINFSGFTVLTFGFAPVPCDQGQFFVDKMPRGYNAVELGADGHFDKNAGITIGSGTTGIATFDLSF